tara:strand:- start:3055 stop:3441 length:387 start_codon:yes stop_codon:yes gene_type:complete
MNNLYLFIAGLMAGMILFQAALNAPTIFKVYSEEQAGPFLRAIFPKLFLNVAVLGLIGLVLSLIGGRLSLQVFFFISFLLMSISYLIVPATNKARDEGRDESFKYLHLLSVILTLSTLVVCLIILVAT